MRLGTRTKEVIAAVVRDALAAERVIVIPVDSAQCARRMFNAASVHIEAMGGRANARALAWSFTNGSEIKIGGA